MHVPDGAGSCLSFSSIRVFSYSLRGGREKKNTSLPGVPVMWIEINIDVIFINVIYLNFFIKLDMEGANVI